MEQKKINIAEILKDCPSGMELDSPMWDNIVFDHVNMKSNYPICIIKMGEEKEYLTEDGCYNFDCGAKCVIFPKGKTTWKGFKPPYKFKDGDIIFKCNFIAIVSHIESNGLIWYHCWYNTKYKDCKFENDFGIGRIDDGDEIRLATEEEKQKLFQAIKDNGYKWNAETKTLEKLPKFKVGDKIRLKENHTYIYTITGIREKENKYECGVTFVLRFSEHDNWELVPDKFNISTLVPFESKVLIRDHILLKWYPAIWGYYDSDSKDYKYKLIGSSARCCIPYKGNEHLLGTANDCDEFYKTW